MMDYQDRRAEEDRTPAETGQVERELWELLGELGASTPGEEGTCPLREGDWLCGAEVRTFQAAGVSRSFTLTRPGGYTAQLASYPRGLVLRLRNGAEFQVTITGPAAPDINAALAEGEGPEVDED